MSEVTSQFVDQVSITVVGGDGGQGCISFLRLKGNPLAGPDGGDGGRGGSVFLEGQRDMLTLLDLKMKSRFAAGHGAGGGSKNCSGKSGADVIIKVPLGTFVLDEDTGKSLGDVVEHGARLLVARGGDGGRGNQHFATSTNKTPRKADEGWPGEQRSLALELKVLADVGLVGLPNAGKSTTLAALTDANPKIAAYPFTTLSPNLGVFLSNQTGHRITLADVPGLIEGAHRGAGLGGRFLRHIERTRVLVHLVSPDAGLDNDGEMTVADVRPETLLYAYELVRKELATYSAKIVEKPTLVVLNKSDLMTEEERAALVQAFRETAGVDVLTLAAQSGEGLDQLRARIEAMVAQEESREMHYTVPDAPPPTEDDKW